MNYLMLDKICEAVSFRALHGLTLTGFKYDDTVLRWVADLGKREGEWLRKHPEVK
jgi:hypothetical protein